jgi:dTDP-4-dehydrorhamnose reductase
MIEQRMKILVTGARGMLGRAITKELAYDYQLIGIDIENADITDENQIKEEIFNIRPDIVIHSAAYTDVDNCEKNKELAFRVNAKGTENVANACKLTNAKLIYISTDFIFDGTKQTPYSENDIPNPLSTYGSSKLEGEKAVQSILQNYSIIRTAWLFGPNGKNFVDTILRLAQSEPELKIVNDQKGSPTYTIDLAKAINLLINKNATGIFNITNSGECTWYEFAKKILELRENPKTIIPITSDKLNRLAKRPAYSVLSKEKFTKTTGTPTRNWQDALKEYLQL